MRGLSPSHKSPLANDVWICLFSSDLLSNLCALPDSPANPRCWCMSHLLCRSTQTHHQESTLRPQLWDVNNSPTRLARDFSVISHARSCRTRASLNSHAIYIPPFGFHGSSQPYTWVTTSRVSSPKRICIYLESISTLHTVLLSLDTTCDHHLVTYCRRSPVRLVEYASLKHKVPLSVSRRHLTSPHQFFLCNTSELRRDTGSIACDLYFLYFTWRSIL